MDSNLPVETSPTAGRSTIPCLVCRSRKVRCDKTLPECRNCGRLGVKCPRYDLDTQSISRSEIQKSAEDIFRAAGVEKRRVGSCEECRASKHRCTRTRPSCRRCMNKSLVCVYPDKGDRLEPHRARLLSSESSPVSQGMQSSYGVFNPPSPTVMPGFGIERDQLYGETLPLDAALRLRLITAFFDRSHPLRCLSFIHRPSFMQSFYRDSVVEDYGLPLLYIICALGARHLYFDQAATSDGADIDIDVPGQAWAERARRDVLAGIHAPNTQHLMTMVLLCDYGIRADQNSMVFVLVSFLYRVIRLLGLDDPGPLENPNDYLAALKRETENRLVWACFFTDLFTATGVDKNACWKGVTPNIPLPCAEWTSLSQTSIPQHYLAHVENSAMSSVLHDLDLSGLSILVMRLRMTGLRLIRTRPEDLDISIWDPASTFLQTVQKLDLMFQNLPEKYHLTDLNINALREQRLLGGVFFLHFLMHSVASDLTRVSLPGFSFPLAVAFQNVTPDFRSQCQECCRFHAKQITELIRKGLTHGMMAFDDVFTADAALESAKIQIIYAATVNQAPEVIHGTRENLSVMFRFFDLFNRGKGGPSQYVRTLMPLCFLFGFRDVAEPWRHPDSTDSDTAEVTGSADVEHLSRFAPFRRARTELKSAHSSSVHSPHTGSSRHTHASPATQDSSHHAPPSVPDATAVATKGTIPNMPPEYQNFAPLPSQPLPVNQGFYQSAPAQIVPQMAGMMPGMSIPQPSVDDYARTADEMSGYLTWQAMEVPPWLNVESFLPPG